MDHNGRAKLLLSRSSVEHSGARREPRPGMVKRCENGEIGMFSLCQPLDISSVTGRCQHCWSHAKAQRRKVRTKCSLSQHFILAPLREVKSWNRQTLESRQSAMFSSSLPVSLSPFHHPSPSPTLHPVHQQLNVGRRKLARWRHFTAFVTRRLSTCSDTRFLSAGCQHRATPA